MTDQPTSDNEAAQRLLEKWLADESGYDERVWPVIAFNMVKDNEMTDLTATAVSDLTAAILARVGQALCFWCTHTGYYTPAMTDIGGDEWYHRRRDSKPGHKHCDAQVVWEEFGQSYPIAPGAEPSGTLPLFDTTVVIPGSRTGTEGQE